MDNEYRLTDREREILRLVVKSFIDTAGPIGSRFLARRYPLGLSPASIRNTMSDLEELGYLGHPYTSAGRIPTEMGYRKFVDELMEATTLSPQEKKMLKAELERIVGDTEDMLRESSRLLGRFSNLLGIVLTPNIATSVLDRLEVVPLTATRAMFVLSMRGGLVKTLIFEIDSTLERDALERIIDLLNERLSGLTLEEIRKTYEPRIRDLEDDRTGVVRLVLNEASTLFAEQSENRRLSYGGTQNMLMLPEFQEPSDLRNIIELVENEDYVVHMLEGRRVTVPRFGDEFGKAVVTIGRENSSEKAEKCSIVTAQYKLGDVVGTIGVIGPMRMDYARVVALVESMATILSRSQES